MGPRHGFGEAIGQPDQSGAVVAVPDALGLAVAERDIAGEPRVRSIEIAGIRRGTERLTHPAS
ncbi:hypothetical protein [Nocardia sp. NPDC050717]|uniref:hypothetical protein n=1 Tax=Nocardia sp. NPDC050717 TaxID=3157221 RepID=UPI0033CFECD8